jgi:hypothetical protein
LKVRRFETTLSAALAIAAPHQTMSVSGSAIPRRTNRFPIAFIDPATDFFSPFTAVEQKGYLNNCLAKAARANGSKITG